VLFRSSRSVRTLMPFLLIPGNSADYIKKREADFADIRAYLQNLDVPRYPFSIDQALAGEGKAIYERTCMRCHGGPAESDSYPNKLIELDRIGTDPTLATAFAPQGVEHYLESWFAREHGPQGEPYHGLGGGGYQAPPLNGVWATAPYLHNGSVPTIHGVLKSSDRPGVFTRSFRGAVGEYDRIKVGFKVTVLKPNAISNLSSIDRRRIYDTSQPGRGNRGHTFGDTLTETARMALIEYLKTF